MSVTIVITELENGYTLYVDGLGTWIYNDPKDVAEVVQSTLEQSNLHTMGVHNVKPPIIQSDK